MANIKEQIEDITYAVKSMIDSGFLPDYIDLLKEQDHQGYNDFFIVSRADAELQYAQAKELYEEILNYLC